MSVIEVKEKHPLSLAQVQDALKKLETRDGELNFRAKRVKEYVEIMKPASIKDADALEKKLTALDIPRLKSQHIAKLVDIHPQDMDSVKLLFSAEHITIKQEDLDKILSVMKA